MLPISIAPLVLQPKFEGGHFCSLVSILPTQQRLRSQRPAGIILGNPDGNTARITKRCCRMKVDCSGKDTAAVLSSVDYNFVAQANLGAPFQIDSGRIAEQKGMTPAIRDYAHLMVVSHVPVVDALNKVLQRKGLTAPPNPLLHGAYDAMINSLKAEQGRAFDRDYVDGQVQYQEGNAALFRYEIENGTDSDLKEFARQTLPKIEDHLKRALKLANATDVAAPN
jgi:putative membrane protein